MVAAHRRRVLALRYWLIGRRFHTAAQALDFAEARHTGVRKDGLTPEFDHPVTVAQYVRTLVDGLMYPEDTLSAALLHDVCEDHDVEIDEIRGRFGHRTADAVWCLTKEYKGEKRDAEEVFTSQAANPIASVCKGADRIHNVQTMVGVFTATKQAEYMTEAEQRILPMIKSARRAFPQQEPVYENIKLVLRSQIALIREIHRAAA